MNSQEKIDMGSIKKSSIWFFAVIIIDSLFTMYVKTGIAAIITVLLYSTLIYILHKEHTKIQLNSKRKYSFKQITYMIFFTCMILVCYTIAEENLLSFLFPGHSPQYHFKGIEIVSAVIFAPISEELLFRGILLNQLNRKYSFLVANMIQAIIFGVLHFDIYAFIFLTFFAFIMGIVYKEFNIYCCMLMHSLNNLLVVLEVYYKFNTVDNSVIGQFLLGFTFLAVTIGFLLIITIYPKAKRKKINMKQKGV